MRGWFDQFRDNGGPTIYSHSNRTAVTVDTQSLILYIVFITLYFSFIIIFPGVRRQRFTTFTSVTLSLFVGTAILVSQHGSAWHTAEAEVSTAYRAFSKEKVMGTLGVHIGLNFVNVTLKAKPIYNQSENIDFNERFYWIGPDQMKEDYLAALFKGLPFPILTVAEYFTVDAEGFCWGRNYRQAGYFTSIFLWIAFGLWVFSNIMLIVVPRYGAYLLTLTGFTLLMVNAIYYLHLPVRPLVIRLEQAFLTFHLGWSFWLVLVAGCLCFTLGSAVSIIDLIYPHKFSTILEVDFGTPFDRHTIIEDSHETKKKKDIPRLEAPPSAGLGSRLLRRLSKRDREGRSLHPDGRDNFAFEMEAPKSPWRYPHLMFRADSRKQKAVSFRQHGGGRSNLELPGIPGFGEFAKHLRRTDSKDSECSSLSSAPVPGSQHDLRPTLSVPVSHVQFDKFRRTDSESSGSSFASLGLSVLSRGGSKVDRVSRGRGLDHRESDISLASVNSDRRKESSGSKRGDEVAIVVSNRKDSITNAVRRVSGEHQRPGGDSSW